MNIKNILSSFKNRLRWSDLFLLLYSCFFIPIFLEDNRFLNDSSGLINTFNIPFYIIVILFACMITCLIVYLFLEDKEQHIKFKKTLFIFYVFLVLSQLITVSLTPSVVRLNLFDIQNNPVEIGIQVSDEIKCTHFFVIFFIITTIFITFFIFSKRIKHFSTISFVIYLFYLIATIMLVYSIINDDYITLFKFLTKQATPEIPIKYYAPSSFCGNPNTYGVFLQVIFFLALLNYSINNKKHNLVIAVIVYFHLLITISKTGIVATTISLFIYLVIKGIVSIINKDKRGSIIYLSISSLFLLSFMTIFLILVNSDFYQFIFYKADSFTGRIELWYFSYQITSKTSFIHGAGHGIYNTLFANAYGYDASVTHNSFLLLLGEGGILFLIPFLAMILFASVKGFKNVIHNKKAAVCLCVLISFLIHSFFEDSPYLVVSMIIILMIVINIDKSSNNLTSKEHQYLSIYKD